MWFIPVAIILGLGALFMATKSGNDDLVDAYRATLCDIALTGKMTTTQIARLSQALHAAGELQRSDNLDTLLAQGAGTGPNTPLMTRVAAAAGTHDGAVMVALANQLEADKPTGWQVIAAQLLKLSSQAQTNPQKVQQVA